MQVHGLRDTKMQRKYQPKNRKAPGNNCNKCNCNCCNVLSFCSVVKIYMYLCCVSQLCFYII